jgi:hypothetical protein
MRLHRAPNAASGRRGDTIMESRGGTPSFQFGSGTGQRTEEAA